MEYKILKKKLTRFKINKILFLTKHYLNILQKTITCFKCSKLNDLLLDICIFSYLLKLSSLSREVKTLSNEIY